MNYSLVPLLGLVILFVLNYDIIFMLKGVKKIPAFKQYRMFLISVLLFFIFDAMWGLFEYFKLDLLLLIDTSLYFVSMSVTVFLWTVFITKYLEERKVVSRIMISIGALILVVGIGAVVANLFNPVVLFNYKDGSYSAGIGRYIFLYTQMGLFIVSAIYAIIISMRNKTELSTRYFVIGVFGVLMALTVLLQVFEPLLPYYAGGIIISICFVHTFVLNIEKIDLREEIKNVQNREKEQLIELDTTKHLVYTDALTGVKSKHAYVELEETIDDLIRKNMMGDFALVLFDLNYLKAINDSLGHNNGDKYLIESVEMIKKFFPDIDIYRFGGDEFVLILDKENYADRYKMLKAFSAESEKDINKNKPVVACGMSDYIRGQDNALRTIFNRADENMYANKRMLKEMNR